MSTSFLLLTVFVPLFGQNAEPTGSHNCFSSFDQFGSGFDMCDLQLVHGLNLEHYTIEGKKNTDETDKYKYLFNIGASVADIDKLDICSNVNKSHSYCNYTTDNQQCIDSDENTTPITNEAWAYQIKFTGNETDTEDIECHYLSNYNGGPPQWRLINDLNPVEGVILTYLKGDFDGACGKNREFSIKFECEDTGERFMPSHYGLIDEYALCSYTWTVQSLHGCPTQCPRAHEKLCTGNGLCSYDNTMNASRCYCFGTWTGADCLINDTSVKIWDIIDTKNEPEKSDFVHTFNGTMNNQSYKVTYDLTKWKLSAANANFQVTDKFNNINVSKDESIRDNFHYYMGVMEKINVPSSCINSVNLTKKAYAIQQNSDTLKCYILGTKATWALFDTIDDPAHGVTLEYTDGDSEGCFGSNRTFSVSMVCPDFVMNNNNKKIFDTRRETIIETFVEEPVACSYNIQIETAIACPYQCKTTETTETTETQEYFTICSTHGMCVSDPFIGQVRCLCDDEWHGAVCNTPPTNSPTTNPTKSPTVNPTMKPTVKPTNFPTGSPVIAQVVVKKQKDNHTAFILSILLLCFVVIIAIFVGRYCYKKMKSTHEEFKEYTKFRDNTEKKKGVIGFSMRGNAGKVNVADNSDEEHNDDQLL